LFIALAACSHPAPAPSQPVAMPQHDHDHHDHASHSMHHRFEHADEWTKQFDDPARDAWQQPDKVVAAMAITPGMSVADVGAGTGYFESRLSAAVGPNGKVLAVDIEPDMVRYMNERRVREKTWNVEARLGAADDPKLDAVDRILIVDTWHHIENREAYAKKLVAALKPGGIVFVVDFKQESEKGPPKHMRIPPAQIVAELAAAGLDARQVDVDLPDQFIVSAAAK
jgi:ubiquinone/menaquinone biosynthesis C-methylase UbiE